MRKAGAGQGWLIKVARAVIAIVTLVLFYAIFVSRFLPSPLTHSIALWSGAACAISGIVWAIIPQGFNPSAKVFQQNPMPGWLDNTAVRSAVSALFLGYFGYTVSLTGFPSLYTRWLGDPGEVTMTINGTSLGGRVTCSRFLVLEYPDLPNRALCATYHELATSPIGEQLVAVGRQSRFGLEVENLVLPWSPTAEQH